MSEATPNARALFGQALEIDTPEERAAFLDRACGADSALRAEVAGLLHALAQAGDFMEAPAAGTVNHTYLGEAPGGQVGPYKLLQAIGEGGMGVVFLAEQIEPVRRQVALKVIKPGMDSAQVIARFEAERQALALMDHPHIARVLDAGATAAGRPFFVMELVRGVPITRYCDELHLDLRQRLELFVPVCQAIQHAHQKGVIHRDVKPSNILVCLQDGKPVPKVIDFGVAKAIDQRLTEKTLWTQFGAMVGTLEYMSPEQAELSPLGIDTRSDVYSLGVLLYELLTGTTPLSRKRLREAGHEEVVRLIKEEEPPRPSTRLSSSDTLPTVAAARRTEAGRLAKQVRGELDWIVMKALEKDRTRRYETANGLARDVERYLADEPVEACPPSATYRLRKFARKHARVLATAIAFVMLLLAGTALSAWLAVRATEAEQEAQTALGRISGEQRKTQAALTDATQAKARTFAAMNALTDDVIEQFLTRQAQLGAPEKAFLRKVQGFYEEFAAERGHTEEARQTVAQGQFRLARIHYLLGERAAAETALHAAVPLLEKLTADFPGNPSHRLFLANCFQNLGLHRKLQGKYVQAEAASRRNIQHLEKLVADFPDTAAYPPRLADASSDLAMVLDTLGKREEAEAVLGRALDQLQKLPAGFLTAADVSRYRVHGYVNLGDLLSRVGKHVESERAYRRAISLGKKLTAAFPTDPEHRRWLAGSYQHLGVLLTSLPRRAAAETACRQALALSEGLVAEFPAVPNYRLDLAVCLRSLARVLGDRGKQAEAEATFGRAIALQEKLVAAFPALPDYHVELAASHAALGMLFGRLGNLPEAEKPSRRAIALHEKLAADYPGVVVYRRELAGSLREFADILKKAGKGAEARAAFRRAIALNEKLAADFPARPDYRRELALCCHHLSAVLDNEGKHAEAETSVRQAIALQEKLASDFPALPSYRRELGWSNFNLGASLFRRGQLAKAEIALRRGISLVAKLPADPNFLADERRHLFISQACLVYVLLRQNRRAEVAAALQEAVALHDQLTKDLSEDVVHRDDLAGSHHILARLMQDMGMREAAAGAYQQAIAVREKLVADFPTVLAQRESLATSLNNLGNVLEQLRRLPEAEAVFRRAIALQEKLAADFPAEAHHRVALAGTYVNLGFVRMVRGQPLDSLDWHGKAIALLEPIFTANDRVPSARQFLCNAHRNRALALGVFLKRHTEAARDWGRAAELDDGRRRNSLINRARSLARAGDHARAVALVTELTQASKATGQELYDLACACALSSSAAKEDAGLRAQYAGRAVALLRQAQATGYFQAKGRMAFMQKDENLEALRQRPDFGKLLAELKAAPGAK